MGAGSCGQGSTGTLKEASAGLSCRQPERREVLDTAANLGGRKEGAQHSAVSIFIHHFFRVLPRPLPTSHPPPPAQFEILLAPVSVDSCWDGCGQVAVHAAAAATAPGILRGAARGVEAGELFKHRA